MKTETRGLPRHLPSAVPFMWTASWSMEKAEKYLRDWGKKFEALLIPRPAEPVQSGAWKVYPFEVTFDLQLMRLWRDERPAAPGWYTGLSHRGNVVMSDTPAEILDHWNFVHLAEGHVLVAGLGLGVVLHHMLLHGKVDHVTVIEKEPDVITLTGPRFEGNPKVSIIQADIDKWTPPRGVKYDYVWLDIWNSINVECPAHMTRLRRRFASKTKGPGRIRAWCEDEARALLKGTR